MVTCIFSKLRQAASSIVIDDRRIVLLFLSFNNSWSLVCAQKICFTEQEKRSNQSSIITKARYVFPKMHVDSIRYKSWMLKAGSDPPGFRHTLKLINYARDLSIQKLRHLRSNLRQRCIWRQPGVALVALTVCIPLFWSAQSSPIHSSIQSQEKWFDNSPNLMFQEVNRPEQVTVTLSKLWHKIY